MPCTSIEVLLVTAAGGFIAIARGVLDLLLVAVHVVDLGRGGRVLRLLVVTDAQETREPQRQALLGVRKISCQKEEKKETKERNKK